MSKELLVLSLAKLKILAFPKEVKVYFIQVK